MKPEKIIELYSEKYSVKGRIEDYGVVIKLMFSYDGKEYVLGLHNCLNKTLDESGLETMESTIEHLASSGKGNMYLHYWYIQSCNGIFIARGNVTGNPKINDSVRIHTSPVVSVSVDENNGEVLVFTVNSIYHCPLDYWDFGKQDEYEIKDLIPDYDSLKEKNSAKTEYPEIEQGKVLLVLADFCDYYFHSLCVKDGNGDKIEYSTHSHIGMFQDSFLIGLSKNAPRSLSFPHHIDLRYFPHYKNIEFYSDETDGMPLYAENIGNSDIYIRRSGLSFCLKPGERKELVKKNAEKDINNLPDGDLYPAEIEEG